MKFLEELKYELSIVTWPNKKEIMDSVIVTISATLLCCAIIFISDFIFAKIFGLILR